MLLYQDRVMLEGLIELPEIAKPARQIQARLIVVGVFGYILPPHVNE